MGVFEISLSKKDLEYIANGYGLKINIRDEIFSEVDEIILKPALMNDLMNPLLDYRHKLIDTGLQNKINNFTGGAR